MPLTTSLPSKTYRALCAQLNDEPVMVSGWSARMGSKGDRGFTLKYAQPRLGSKVSTKRSMLSVLLRATVNENGKWKSAQGEITGLKDVDCIRYTGLDAMSTILQTVPEPGEAAIATASSANEALHSCLLQAVEIAR